MKLVREHINFERGNPRKTLGLATTLADVLEEDENLLTNLLLKYDKYMEPPELIGTGIKGEHAIYQASMLVRGVDFDFELNATSGDLWIEEYNENKDEDELEKFRYYDIKTFKELERLVDEFVNKNTKS